MDGRGSKWRRGGYEEDGLNKGTEQFRQHLSCFSQITFRERQCVRGILRPHVDCPRTTSNLGNKTGGGLHHARRSYGYEHSAGIQRLINSLQLERHLAEPRSEERRGGKESR